MPVRMVRRICGTDCYSSLGRTLGTGIPRDGIASCKAHRFVLSVLDAPRRISSTSRRQEFRPSCSAGPSSRLNVARRESPTQENLLLPKIADRCEIRSRHTTDTEDQSIEGTLHLTSRGGRMLVQDHVAIGPTRAREPRWPSS